MQIIRYEDDFQGFIQFFGRHKKTETGHAFYYTGSGFKLQAKGSFIKLAFHSYYEEVQKKPYLVIQDGQDTSTYDLSLDITEITHKIKNDQAIIYVYKRSESMMSRTELVSVETDGKILTCDVDQKRLKLLFIGDSLTCGYGNLSSDTDIPFDTSYEDGLNAYASLAAQALQADYEIVAVSGIGLYKSIYANVTMPSIYEQYDIYDTTPYPFVDDKDYIVINLGTNDYSYMKFLVEPTRIYEEKRFIETYKGFIQRIKEIHKKSHIIIISQGKRQGPIDAAIEQLVKDLNDTTISHFRTSDIKEEDGMGQQYHPTVVTHQRWGNEIKNFIESIRK